ncbi:MAG TPA: 3-dehydroquinate synthase, partial [Phycisphaerae bacterium]|nr:3-dehydroquinate synthase [Phycisphaerae bacterium]
MSRTVAVNLGERSYTVTIGAGVLDQLGPTAAEMGDVQSAAVVSDSNVAPLYGAQAVESLRGAGVGAELITFPAGEEHKSLATCGHLYDALFAISPPIDRRTVVVALGGGVVGDVAGFVAATALRGLRYIQCPTTLLADVDSSVGGKTGVDHATGKNLIGAFHQPGAVLIDVALLASLPDAELANGLAECVKHGVIRDPALLEFIEDRAEEILQRRPDVMAELVERNVAIKAAVVSADEREAGQRAHLNFGHTFGHAIECFVGYDRIRHWQAVALGMVAACRMAAARGLIEQEAAERVEGILSRLGLPTRWSGLDGEEIWRIMQHDKKVR